MVMACDADVVIGADGIHSIVKREIGLTARPTSEGIVAYRGLVPAEKLSWAGELRGLNMWMGDGRSFICFPVSQGRLINIVAFIPSTRDMEETWFAPGDVKALAGEYGGGTLPSGTSSQRSITPFAGASMKATLTLLVERLCHASWRCRSSDGPAFRPGCRASH